MHKIVHSLEVIRKEYFIFGLIFEQRFEQVVLDLFVFVFERVFMYEIWDNEPNVIDLCFSAFDDLQSA